MANHKRTTARAFTYADAVARLADLDEKRSRVIRKLQEVRPGFVTPRAGGQFEFKAKPEIPLVEMWAEIHWTQAAADMIRAGEYAYISPEFDLDYMDPATGDRIGGALLAIGLTNRPFLRGMAKVGEPDDNNVSQIQVFATGEWSHQLYGRITIEERHLKEMIANGPTVCNTMNADSEHPDTEICVDYNHMSLWGGPDASKAAGWVRGKGCYLIYPKKAATEPVDHPKMTTPSNQGAITMKEDRIRELLKLSADTQITDEHRDQALDALDQELAQRPALQAPAGSVALSQAEVETLRSQAEAGSQALNALKERDAKDAVKAALSAHKITAAQTEWAEGYALKDPAGFAAFVAGAQVVVPEGRDGDNGAAPEGDEAAKVAAFISNQTSNSVSLADAMVAAVKQFGQPAFDAYKQSLKAA